MSKLNKSQVSISEEKLRRAMIASDIDELNLLLSDDLIFTNHLGQLVTKDEDINGHKTGIVKINELTPEDQRIQIHGDVAVVSVLVRLSGSYNGIPGEGDFRFTRLWAVSPNGNLHVIAGHACVVA